VLVINNLGENEKINRQTYNSYKLVPKKIKIE